MRQALLYPGLLATRVLGNKPILQPELAASDIDRERLGAHISELHQIALSNNGNRAHNTAGYNASVDYVQQVIGRYGGSMNTYVQPFTIIDEEFLNVSLTGPNGESVEGKPLRYSTSTPHPEGVTAPLVAMPVDDERGSSCFEDQWKGLGVKGKIVLIKRGTCEFSQKLSLAKRHGAVAVVLDNSVPGNPFRGTLEAKNVGKLVPAIMVRQDVGQEWRRRLAANETLQQVTLVLKQRINATKSWNIISETKEGDPDSVVMLGAHLDGVEDGPGINDNGSGSSALLEILGTIQKYTGYKNKVRFAWWGAEEVGLRGSIHYVKALTKEEKRRIRFYFNYDMIGSPNPIWDVQFYKDADKYGANRLLEHLQKAGKPANMTEFGINSDHFPFLLRGIPSSGICTGASDNADPCYHKACDGKDNVNIDALELSTRAAADVAAQLALSLDGLPSRNETGIGRRRKRGVSKSFESDQAYRMCRTENMRGLWLSQSGRRLHDLACEQTV